MASRNNKKRERRIVEQHARAHESGSLQHQRHEFWAQNWERDAARTQWVDKGNNRNHLGLAPGRWQREDEGCGRVAEEGGGEDPRIREDEEWHQLN